MRLSVTFPVIVLAGFALGGCVASTTPVGVLPREPVPPPPSVSSESARRPAATPRTGATSQRRGLSVPGQTPAPRP
ncbi:hypothetical protein [Microvirga sp. VF16]|uniref:hypothetical protein n=1 Tax=Microvirga sp. VF16 TaxID=2807101 RepID=UPI00193D1A2E|nr:hypothetical protein [Microvirga sp. VF16]QRM27943.1 hypothetical protein JO965_16985 [Microvirga sp. VF16]